MEFQLKEHYGYEDLLLIMEKLRGPGGCPWDREQDHHSIRKNLLEEAYEAAEAIDREDDKALCEELGDVLLQVVFHAQMEKEHGGFTMDQVADGICKKLIYRHPHIFADVTVENSAQVLSNWDKLKRREKGQKTTTDAMSSVAASLPALMRAQKVQAKAAKVGFDWDNVGGALDKVREELDETRQALNGQGEVDEEIGDLLFAAVNVARFAGVDAEEALEGCTRKFIRRFQYVEQEAGKMGKKLEEMSLAEMDELWNRKKTLEKT